MSCNSQKIENTNTAQNRSNRDIIYYLLLFYRKAYISVFLIMYKINKQKLETKNIKNIGIQK